MRIPKTPPPISQLIDAALESGRLTEILGGTIGPLPDGKYLHWDKLRYMPPPDGLTVEEWWLAAKYARMQLYQPLPLKAKDGESFQYVHTPLIIKTLHEIDRDASGTIKGTPAATDSQSRDTYIFKTLMEEAITSSQLEGASTTRKVAKHMLQTGRKPRTHDEQMIYNNFQAMSFIREIRHQRLTPKIILELQRILTDQTLDDNDAAGRLRRQDEDVRVVDRDENILHIPPPAGELTERMRQMCDFANAILTDGFIHPVIRAIFLHFWLAYDHPFVDGNGRTARALFYWSMAHEGYWLCEFLSISRILKKAPGRYARSFLYTETDDNDATYFIISQLRVISRAIEELHAYLQKKQQEIYETQQLLQRSQAVSMILNQRQLGLINHALKNPRFIYTVESHRRSHNISYQTARTDLLQLAEHGLLIQNKVSRKFTFSAPPDLRTRLERLTVSE